MNSRLLSPAPRERQTAPVSRPFVVVVAGPTATAWGAHCGACRFPVCCPQTRCLPAVRYRVCYQTVMEDRTCIAYRPVYQTVLKECRSTTYCPVYEQHVREHRYVVC